MSAPDPLSAFNPPRVEMETVADWLTEEEEEGWIQVEGYWSPFPPIFIKSDKQLDYLTDSVGSSDCDADVGPECTY